MSTIRKLYVCLAAVLLLSGQTGLSQAQDSTAYQRPSIGYTKPPAANADNVPASGIQGQVNNSQVESLDGTKVTGTVSRATDAVNAINAQSATMAVQAQTAITATTSVTAMQVDPNATIDASKITNLPSCLPNEMLATVAGVLKCVSIPTSEVSNLVNLFTRLLPSSGSFTIPAGSTRVRVHAIGGGAGSSWFYAGGGGGYCRKEFSVTPGDVISYTVGAAGVHLTNPATGFPSTGPAPNGSATTVAKNGVTVCIAGGAINTTAGTGTGGDVNYTGGAGAYSAAYPVFGGGAAGQSGNGYPGAVNTWNPDTGLGSAGSISGQQAPPYEGGAGGKYSVDGTNYGPGTGGGGGCYSGYICYGGGPGALWIQY